MTRACAVLAVLSLLLSTNAVAGKHVGGYVKKSGTYVAPHVRTAPDATRVNNYSTKGNVNPYTGEKGSKPVVKPTTYPR